MWMSVCRNVDVEYPLYGWKRREIRNSAELREAVARYPYSPFSFRGGVRRSENTEAITAVVLDFDNDIPYTSVTMDEIAEKLRKRGLRAFLIETKSSGKEKKGVVAERFRAIIPFTSEASICKEDRGDAIENAVRSIVGEDVLRYTDKGAIRDVARMYRPSPATARSVVVKGDPVDVETFAAALSGAREAKRREIARIEEERRKARERTVEISGSADTLTYADLVSLFSLDWADVIGAFEQIEDDYRELGYRYVVTPTAKYGVINDEVVYDFRSGTSYNKITYLKEMTGEDSVVNAVRVYDESLVVTNEEAVLDAIDEALENGVDRYVDLNEYLKTKFNAWFARFDRNRGVYIVAGSEIPVDADLIERRMRENYERKNPLTTLTSKQRLALDLAIAGKNLFITGGAGVGKSHVYHLIAAELERRGKTVYRLSTTGIAARNVRGVTAHSQFRLPRTPAYLLLRHPLEIEEIVEKNKWLEDDVVLMIDEVGMLRSDTFDLVLEILRRSGAKAQIVLFGDPFQLPPVVREDEAEELFSAYQSEFFFDAHRYGDFGFEIVVLDVVHRQKGDQRFIDILNRMRTGDTTDADLAVLSSKVAERDPKALTLITSNRRAKEINERELEKLDGEEFAFSARTIGEVQLGDFPIEKELKLKVGARVVLTQNDTSKEKRYRNGDLGTVVKIDRQAYFDLDGNLRKKRDEYVIEVVFDANGKKVYVFPNDFNVECFVSDEENKRIKKEIVGTVRQFPIRLAYAVTIHKSQGMTIPRLHVNLARVFAPGQTYVAFSRATGLDGLTLEKPLTKEEIMVHERVKEFHAETDGRNVAPCAKKLHRDFP